MSAAADIEALIEETDRWRSFHVGRRDQRGMSVRDREAEALACNIRSKALREVLALVKARESKKP